MRRIGPEGTILRLRPGWKPTDTVNWLKELRAGSHRNVVSVSVDVCSRNGKLQCRSPERVVIHP